MPTIRGQLFQPTSCCSEASCGKQLKFSAVLACACDETQLNWPQIKKTNCAPHDFSSKGRRGGNTVLHHVQSLNRGPREIAKHALCKVNLITVNLFGFIAVMVFMLRGIKLEFVACTSRTRTQYCVPVHHHLLLGVSATPLILVSGPCDTLVCPIVPFPLFPSVAV